jgi:hypothetical protein
MSYDTKVASARTVIESHNENIDKELQINFDEFLKSLQKEGGTSEASLAQCSWEMLQKLSLPILIAKQVGKIFRGKSSGENKSVYVSERKASCMSPKELLERYNPKDVENAIGERLQKISRGNRCIVFNDDGSVNVDKSAELISDIQDDLPELTKTLVGGVPKQVFKVGERTDNYADENPIYPGRVLRSGGTCDQTGRSWDGVSLVVRQLLNIAVNETGELSIKSLDDAHNALDKAVMTDAEKVIRSRYQEASIYFDECLKTGELPVLKVALGSKSSGNGRREDPFYNRTY